MERKKMQKKKSVYANLPIPKQKKSKLTGRVGRSTNNAKKFMKTNISNQFISQKDIEKLSAEEVSVSDIPLFNPHQNLSAFPKLTPFQSSGTHISLGVENIVGSKRKITERKSEAGELTIVKVIGNNNVPAKKTRSLKLSLYEEKHINSNNMLSDELIDLAQQLLGKQFPDFAGSGDIALTEQSGFDLINAAKPFIQILLTGSAHWICFANIKQNRAHNDCCEVYDSLNSGNITAEVADTMANMLYCRKPEIKILIKSVQQRNYVDYGVFAIAFATSLGFGDRPEEIIYDSKIMRQHLLNCLRNKRTERFPVQDGNTIQHCKRKTLVIEVFFSCRQPYYPVIVMCTKWEEWFHVDCERIPRSAIDNEDIDFFCTALSEISKISTFSKH